MNRQTRILGISGSLRRESYNSAALRAAAVLAPEGAAQIRSLFEKIFDEMFPPASSSLNLAKQVVEGEIAYILWSGSSSHSNAPFATDTFVIGDGKIIAQTFAAQLEAK